MHNYQTLYYIAGIVVLVGGALWSVGRYAFRNLIMKPIKYFARLENLLSTMGKDIYEIKTNHLHDLENRLRFIEEVLIEARQDSNGHARGDRDNFLAG